MKKSILLIALLFASLNSVSAKAENNPPRTIIVRVEKSTGAVSMSGSDQLIDKESAANAIHREFKSAPAVDELDRDSSTSGWYYYYGANAWVAPVYYYYGNAYYYSAYYYFEYAAYFYYFYRW